MKLVMKAVVKQTHAQTQAHRGRGDCANGDIACSAKTLRSYMVSNVFFMNEKVMLRLTKTLR